METGELRGLDGYELCAVIGYINAHQPTCAVVVHNHWDYYLVFRVDNRDPDNTMTGQFGRFIAGFKYGVKMESVEAAYKAALEYAVGCALGHLSDT